MGAGAMHRFGILLAGLSTLRRMRKDPRALARVAPPLSRMAFCSRRFHVITEAGDIDATYCVLHPRNFLHVIESGEGTVLLEKVCTLAMYRRSDRSHITKQARG